MSMKQNIKNLITQLRISVIVLALMALFTCGMYPATIWGVGQILFPYQANGSIVMFDGKPVGSILLSQGFSDPKYFYPRPSFAGAGYDATRSGGSNLGPTSKKLVELVSARADHYRRQNGLDPKARVPVDAVTASASGLDPHISPENARIQAPRVARLRSVNENRIIDMILQCSSGPDLGILGHERVNVLKLNLMLDGRNCD